MKKFNVLEYNWTTKKLESYDVLPYFRNQWKSKSFNRKDVKTREGLKQWIDRASHYQFWSRCEYEFLMAPWPFVLRGMIEELQKVEINKENDIKISNIITKDMDKVDVHQQIMMNIDVITDILCEEFKIT